MVHQLINSGANNIWEYTLLDPTQNRTTRKKPTTKDPVQWVLAFLSLVHDDNNNDEDDDHNDDDDDDDDDDDKGLHIWFSNFTWCGLHANHLWLKI